jgi:FAD/FMN-containing dehydrogenase
MDSFLEELEQIVGPSGLLTGSDVSMRSDNFQSQDGCKAKAIVRPTSTREVSEVLKLCHAKSQTVVTHGGLTGLVKGAIAKPEDIIVSLERMKSIDAVDRDNRTITVEAGVPLQAVHQAAQEAGLLFPLDFGARGSATIGGCISTNAGGNSVVRYGMTREQVLGIEAVLADGTIISSMNTVIKNNTGYDLKQLFIGSEGTLGIVTRAVLRLRPLPSSCNTALVAVNEYAHLGKLLRMMDTSLGGTLSAFEVMWNDFYVLITGNGETHTLPLDIKYPFYVLVEAKGSHAETDRSRFEQTLEQAMSQQLVADAAITQSQKQRQHLWDIRDDIDNLLASLEPAITFDVSLGIADMDDYVQELRGELEKQWPHYQMVVFGHLGDGNIHLAVSVGDGDEKVIHQVDSVAYSLLEKYRGIISAEHGIGLSKRDFLIHSRSEEEVNLMRTLKIAMDPGSLLNPGKIFQIQKQVFC